MLSRWCCKGEPWLAWRCSVDRQQCAHQNEDQQSRVCETSGLGPSLHMASHPGCVTCVGTLATLPESPLFLLFLI